MYKVVKIVALSICRCANRRRLIRANCRYSFLCRDAQHIEFADQISEDDRAIAGHT
jgi:hypothetical protein